MYPSGRHQANAEYMYRGMGAITLSKKIATVLACVRVFTRKKTSSQNMMAQPRNQAKARCTVVRSATPPNAKFGNKLLFH